MKTAVLLSVGLSLLAGYLYGDELRRRKNAEEYARDLTKLLEKASFKTPPPEAQLKKMAAVLNDAHKQITAVSKALKKPTP
jgi:hypothetical protein